MVEQVVDLSAYASSEQLERLGASTQDVLWHWRRVHQQILRWRCPNRLLGDYPGVRWQASGHQVGRYEQVVQPAGQDQYYLILEPSFTSIREALDVARWAVHSGQLTAEQGIKVLQEAVRNHYRGGQTVWHSITEPALLAGSVTFFWDVEQLAAGCSAEVRVALRTSHYTAEVRTVSHRVWLQPDIQPARASTG